MTNIIVALQRVIGSQRAQVLRMTGVEGLVVAIIGILLGGLVSTLTLVPFGLALDGSPVPTGPLSIYFTVIGSATALTLATTLVASWVALRPRPVAAL
jgi:putative ABC transport system permease protein